MLRTIEAVIEPDGRVRLLEPLTVREPRRALVTVLDEAANEVVDDATSPALLSEPALAADWNRPEEEAAWEHLQDQAP